MKIKNEIRKVRRERIDIDNRNQEISRSEWVHFSMNVLYLYYAFFHYNSPLLISTFVKCLLFNFHLIFSSSLLNTEKWTRARCISFPYFWFWYFIYKLNSLTVYIIIELLKKSERRIEKRRKKKSATQRSCVQCNNNLCMYLENFSKTKAKNKNIYKCSQWIITALVVLV